MAGTSMPAGATIGTMPAAAAAAGAMCGGTALWCGDGVMKALPPLPTRCCLKGRPASPPSSSSWVLLASASNTEALEGAGPAAAAAEGAARRRRTARLPPPLPMAPLPSSASSSCSASAFSCALVDGRRCRRLLASGPAVPPEPTVAAAPADAWSAAGAASCRACHCCCAYCCGGSAPAAAEGRCGLRLVAPRSGGGAGRGCCSERADTVPDPSRESGPPPCCWLAACPEPAAPRLRLALPGTVRGSGSSALAVSCSPGRAK